MFLWVYPVGYAVMERMLKLMHLTLVDRDRVTRTIALSQACSAICHECADGSPRELAYMDGEKEVFKHPHVRCEASPIFNLNWDKKEESNG